MNPRRALISVSDKTGVVDFARGLVDVGFEIVSSGGTAQALSSAGVPVRKVADVTGAPEILGGRVKTLHPAIHGGILADRRKPDHVHELEEQGIVPVELVVCNLYPFQRTVAQPGVTEDDAIEQIDIGGPAMVRAAAKNFHSVAVIVDPGRYDSVLAELRTAGVVSDDTRRALAVEAFEHTAGYDAAITHYLFKGEFPERLLLVADKVADLRYGENPHQPASFYRMAGLPTGLAAARQLGGKELSYNNLLDVDAAWKLALELPICGAAIIKHSNPCGVATAASIAEAYSRAFDCDRTSAFGGIVAVNGTCDAETATRIAEIFTEVVIAPGFDQDALEILRTKKNLRILEARAHPVEEPDVRRIAGGLLVQNPDPLDAADDVKVVTRREPSDEEWADLRLAWIVVKHVKSNAIVFVRDGAAVGVGAGQMSRVEAVELAARRAGDRARGSACASDAFFPFRDGLDAVARAGARVVIQPGGSVRDDEVIAAADEQDVAMVFTGRRHFRH